MTGRGAARSDDAKATSVGTCDDPRTVPSHMRQPDCRRNIGDSCAIAAIPAHGGTSRRMVTWTRSASSA
eukprot:361757-Chlamydomonas_euryale.AAC.1